MAEVPELPGVLAYGASREEAMAKVEALALPVFTENNLTVLQKCEIAM
jgi:predicted RNase H-like HicB family nuclease